jgi:hypothetical protein
MRRTLALAVTAALALLAALGTFLPAGTEAAPAAAYSSISGTLVATPQSTLPATLLLQTGGQTISVVVSTYTQVIDASGNALSLSAMSDGDGLNVTGTTNQSGGIDATTVQDLSQNVGTPPPSAQYTVSGTLATEFSGGLCLQNASVVSGGASPNVATASPCPYGELPVYLGATTFEDANGNAITLSNLQANDTLRATGVLSGGVFTASLVQDLSQSTSATVVSTPVTVTPIATTLVGTVQSTSFNGRNRCFTIDVQQGAVTGAVTICLQSRSQVLLNNAGTDKYTAIRRGQTVTVVGMYNRHTHRWTSTQRVRIQ